jgi:predicted ATPase/Flp pilus assembly protein TadD
MERDPSATDQPYVFISYASVDRARVLRIVDSLQAAGIRVWMDQDEIQGGTQYGSEISDGIRGCAALALCCSKASLSSRNVKQEIMLAWKYQRPYLPLLLEPTTFPQDVEYWLEGSQWIEVLDYPAERWVPRVLAALMRTATPQAPIPPAPIPTRRIQSNLPAAADLVGRARVAQDIENLVVGGTHRLVTMTGPGGTGKTRLSLHVASRVQSQFDAVVFVPLAAISGAELVLPTIANTLGLREEQGQTLLEQVVNVVGDQRLLLVLDNFEHVIDAAADVNAILDGCPSVTIVVTSRVRLGLYGEQEYPVPPLERPDLRRQHSVEDLAQNEAVALFVQRARALKPDFRLTESNAAAVADICVRLDGLPLAIELAAARIKLLNPQAMRARLDKRLPLLTGGARNLPQRQQTLRNAIAWSYDLLHDEDRSLFRALSVFVGGWTFEAAESLVKASNAPALDVFDGLSSLVDKSLVLQQEDERGETRFGMLETIREFGLDQLTESGEVDAVSRSSVDYFHDLAERAAPELLGEDQELWFAQLELEHDNLRASLGWCLEHEPVVGVALAGKLSRFWYQRGYFSEGRRWLETLIDRGADADPIDRALALYGLAALTAYQGDFAHSRPLAEACLEIYRALNDRTGMAMVLNVLGVTAMHEEKHDEATARWAESLALFRELQDERNMAILLGNLSWISSLEQSYEPAMTYIEESLTLARRMRDRASTAAALQNLGLVALEMGDIQRAEDCFREGLELGREIGSQLDMVECLEGCAAVASVRGQWEHAAWLYGVAAGTRTALGIPMPEWDHIQQKYVAQVRAHLTGSAWSTAWEAGLRVPLSQALEKVIHVATSA